MESVFGRKLTDHVAARECVDFAIAKAKADNRPLTVQRLASACGVGHETLRRCVLGEFKPFDEVEAAEWELVRKELMRGYSAVNDDLSDTLMEHGGNQGAMFLARCCLGYSDVQKVEVITPNINGIDDV